jgi:putative addiction module component (TIGR02574 family)
MASPGFRHLRWLSIARRLRIMVKLDMEAIRKLSVSERLALVEEIWESISADPSSVPVTEAQLAEARRRLTAHDNDSSGAVAWEEAEERLRSKA